MFRLDSVCKSYDGKAALISLSVTIPRGKTTVIIGSSGCGKSTVFGVLTGLLKPDSGQVYFEDRPITPERLPAIRQRIGYVIQDGGLFPHLTCFANVALMARHLGWSKNKIQERANELSKLTRLSPDLLNRYPAEMSGGQRQRVSLMRALMLDADVLLLDEPLAALDPMVRAELQDDLAEIFRRLEKTVVLVTHDLGEAELFADQVILMKDGQIVQTGSMADLFERPADGFVTQFIRAQESRTKTRSSS